MELGTSILSISFLLISKSFDNQVPRTRNYVDKSSFIARPGRSSYSASKFAIEAIHESLSHELATFNIKILIVEPGAFRTPFASRIITPSQHESTGGFSEAYKGTVLEQMVSGWKGFKGVPDFIKGDPEKAANAIVTAVGTGHKFLRLVLGRDCVKAMEDKIGELTRDLEATRKIAMGTDID